MDSIKISVFDFFSGCGGTSSGFRQAGLEIAFALDIDEYAGQTFEVNFPEAKFCPKSITDLDDEDILSIIQERRDEGHLILFAGCAPCQPFTMQQTTKVEHDERAPLLTYFGNLIVKYSPDFVFVENVPGLQKVTGKFGPLPAFNRKLIKNGYSTEKKVVFAQDYGVPQTRKRFIFLGSKLGDATFPEETHGKNKKPYKTVRETISHLPALKAGETYVNDPIHRTARISELNLKRIKHTPHNGGNRLSWPDELKLNCHTKKNSEGKTHSGHTDVYGRLFWDQPSTGLTTKCISLSNGRFGHPEQDRAISLREAALLQTFPMNFQFCGATQSMARQIGNAVPVKLAEEFGKHFMKMAKESNKKVETVNGNIQN